MDRVRAIFMTLWDGISTDSDSQITIIAATNRPWAIDEAIQRRMPYTFHIALPDVSQRETILRIILREEAIEPHLDLKRLANETDGYSGSDLMALCQAAARAPLREHMGDIGQYSGDVKPLRNLQLQDFLDAKQVVGPTGSSANSYRAARNQQQQRNQQPSPNPRVTNVFNFNMFPVSNAPLQPIG